jgi:LPXTG-motif cell wall-anchored protein
MNRRLIAVAVVPAAGVVIALATGGLAHATTPDTRTVYWLTTNDPTKPLPTDASNVNWPQTYLPSLPDCLPKAAVVQIDKWDRSTKAHADLGQQLIDAKTLDEVGGVPQDSTIVTGWSYVVVPACATAPPTPTPTPTSVAPTVTSTVSCGHVDFTVTNPNKTPYPVQIEDVPGDTIPFPATAVTDIPTGTTVIHFDLLNPSYPFTKPDTVLLESGQAPFDTLQSVSVQRGCPIDTGTPTAVTATPTASTPAVVQAAAVKAAVTSSAPVSDALASTGPTQTGHLIEAGAGLLAAGALVLAVARKRSTHE